MCRHYYLRYCLCLFVWNIHETLDFLLCVIDQFDFTSVDWEVFFSQLQLLPRSLFPGHGCFKTREEPSTETLGPVLGELFASLFMDGSLGNEFGLAWLPCFISDNVLQAVTIERRSVTSRNRHGSTIFGWQQNQRQRRRKENGKKVIGFYWQKQICTCIMPFWSFLWRGCTTATWNFLI